MKKRALLYVTFAPFIYLYGLAENHFSFGNTFKGFTYEFLYEYIQGWKILFGGEYKDNSVKIANYEFKQRAKKAKFDNDIAFQVKESFGSLWIRFNKKNKELTHRSSGDYGEEYLHIVQHGKDEFRLGYRNSRGWNNSKDLTTDYMLTKEQVIEIIKMLNSK